MLELFLKSRLFALNSNVAYRDNVEENAVPKFHRHGVVIFLAPCRLGSNPPPGRVGRDGTGTQLLL